MRKTFPGYYRPTDEEFASMWQTGIFTFDANVLLDLYLSPDSKKSQELFRILDRIGDQVWLSHQAALEYQRNRVEKAIKQQDRYDAVQQAIDTAAGRLGQVAKDWAACPALEDLRASFDEASRALSEIQEAMKQAIPERGDVLEPSEAGLRLDALFDGKVGEPYSINRLTEIYEQARLRYALQVPPGYCDEGKPGDRPYGDLVLWYQVIDKGRQVGKPIILITKEEKEDWFRKTKDGKGRTVGPRAELANEMAAKAQVPFYLYRVTQFLEQAEQYIGLNVDEGAIEESRKDDEVEDRARRARQSFSMLDVQHAIDRMAWAARQMDLTPLADSSESVRRRYEMAIESPNETIRRFNEMIRSSLYPTAEQREMMRRMALAKDEQRRYTDELNKAFGAVPRIGLEDGEPGETEPDEDEPDGDDNEPDLDENGECPA